MLDSWIRRVDGMDELQIPETLLPDWLRRALSLAKAGRPAEAVGRLDCQSQRIPADEGEQTPVAHRLCALVMAGIFWQGGRMEEAELWFVRACEWLGHPLVLNEAARFYSQSGRPERAISLRREAIALAPEGGSIRANLGDDLVHVGLRKHGLDYLAQAVQLAPDNPVIRSTWLSDLHYGEDLDRCRLYREHRQWGMVHGAGLVALPHRNRPDPNRRLRVGYLSPDFCQHSVASFFEPLLDARTIDSTEVFGYGNVSAPDEVTARLAAKFHQYRPITGLDDAAAADLIQADGIDILVDLAGHFRCNRLGVFVRKPAPIQVTYLGYPDTTGLSQIDFRFTDPWADLPDAHSYHTERLWSLKEGFLCFRPPDRSPAVDGLPALRNGYVTFGSFNNNRKITDLTLWLWAQVLQGVPGSRMVMKFKGGQSQGLREFYLIAFERLGISRDRVEVLGWQGPQAHLGLYNTIDLALDTYPYHGTTTTCEALWMGVPTVCLLGGHHASRVGLSLLARVGLEPLVAKEPTEYVQKAVGLTERPEVLARIRRSLRARVLGSPLCDAIAFSRTLEQAYRAMWQQWCSRV